MILMFCMFITKNKVTSMYYGILLMFFILEVLCNTRVSPNRGVEHELSPILGPVYLSIYVYFIQIAQHTMEKIHKT